MLFLFVSLLITENILRYYGCTFQDSRDRAAITASVYILLQYFVVLSNITYRQ